MVLNTDMAQEARLEAFRMGEAAGHFYFDIEAGDFCHFPTQKPPLTFCAVLFA